MNPITSKSSSDAKPDSTSASVSTGLFCSHRRTSKKGLSKEAIGQTRHLQASSRVNIVGKVFIDLIPESLIRSLSAGLTVLTAMITPALLISASGTFVLSTSNRLGRVIDRVRKLTEMLEEVTKEGQESDLLPERRALIFDLIDRQTTRAKMLARALMVFYVATGTFVATSVAIGIVTLMFPNYTWIPVVLGIGGTVLLLGGSIVLIFEAQMAIRSLVVETQFLTKLVDYHASRQIPA
jgi:hypothetical protein